MMKRITFLRILILVFWGLSLQISVFADKGSPDGPKYVFLFIGDGLGHTQVSTTEAYLAALQGKNGFDPLNFSGFPIIGQSTTYANNRLITGSAAAGTALATGNKTNINRISMDPAGTIPYETIAEKAKKQGYKIGIVTSVSIDHATPAVFYAHQPDRDMYFEIGIDLINSGFDYFAGGGLLIPDGTWKDQEVNLPTLAAEKGYTVVNTAEAFGNLKPGNGKSLILSPRSAGGASLPYAIDTHPGDLTLADFTAKGIEMLSGDEGFFIMVEGGKIDWLGHANDAASLVREMIAFSEAVDKALDFYHEYPENTLIIVTSDHETGGMSLGHAAMKYETNVELLKYQRSSVEELNKIVAHFRVNQSGNPEEDFNRMLRVLEFDLGLHNRKYETLLDDVEMAVLKELFMTTVMGIGTEKGSYGYSEPFMAKAIEIMNKKAGIAWGTGSHTGVNVPVYAIGTGAERFTGVIDNTDIPRIIGELMGVW
ncbi:MAG: alkaline phosphatase [Bacteroidales bacterium]